MDTTKEEIMYKHIINDYYYGKSDKLNYAIFIRKVSKKTGTERFEAQGYYTNIRALKRGIKSIYASENLLNEDVETLLKNLQLVEDKIGE
jgi:hypothetical protein